MTTLSHIDILISVASSLSNFLATFEAMWDYASHRASSHGCLETRCIYSLLHPTPVIRDADMPLKLLDETPEAQLNVGIPNGSAAHTNLQHSERKF